MQSVRAARKAKARTVNKAARSLTEPNTDDERGAATRKVKSGPKIRGKRAERWFKAATMVQRHWRGRAFRGVVSAMLEQQRKETMRELLSKGAPMLVIVVEGNTLVPSRKPATPLGAELSQHLGYVSVDLRTLTIDTALCKWYPVQPWTNKSASRGSLKVWLKLTSRLCTSVQNRQKLLVQVRDASGVNVTLQDRTIARRSPWWNADVVCTIIMDGDVRTCNIGLARPPEGPEPEVGSTAAAQIQKKFAQLQASAGVRRDERSWVGDRDMVYSFGHKGGVVEGMVVKKWGEFAQSKASSDVRALTDGIDKNRREMFTAGLDVEYYLAFARSLQSPVARRPRTAAGAARSSSRGSLLRPRSSSGMRASESLSSSVGGALSPLVPQSLALSDSRASSRQSGGEEEQVNVAVSPAKSRPRSQRRRRRVGGGGSAAARRRGAGGSGAGAKRRGKKAVRLRRRHRERTLGDDELDDDEGELVDTITRVDHPLLLFDDRGTRDP